jgi:putative phosphoribosyl transferase
MRLDPIMVNATEVAVRPPPACSGATSDWRRTAARSSSSPTEAGRAGTQPPELQVAAALNEPGIGTLLIDVPTSAEEEVDQPTDEHLFDVALLAGRLVGTLAWLRGSCPAGGVGSARRQHGRSRSAHGRGGQTGRRRGDGPARRPPRSGRRNAAAPARPRPCSSPAGGRAGVSAEHARLREPGLREAVRGRARRFREPGALEEVARLATDWFARHLASSGSVT